MVLNLPHALAERRVWMLLALVVALAAVLRGVHFDLMEFKADEVQALDLARFWLDRGVPRYGMMSGVGVRNPPGFMLIMAPVVALTSEPLQVGAVVAAANVLAVLLMGVAFGGWRPTRAGLWAAALMACHPWLVLYSRKIWAQSFLPLLAGLVVAAALRCHSRPRSRAIAVAIPAALLAWQVHYSGVALVVWGLMWLLDQALRARVHWRAFAVGLLVGFALLAPHILHLVETDFADLTATARVAGRSSVVAVAEAFGVTLFARGLSYPFDGRMGSLEVASSTWGVALDGLALAATVAVLLFALAGLALSVARPTAPSSGADSPRRVALWLAAMALCAPVLYSVRSIASPPHYFIVGLPAVLALCGIGIERAPAPRIALASAFTACGAGAALLVFLLTTLDAAGGARGDWGVSYRVQRQAASILSEHSVTVDSLDARYSRDQGVGVRWILARLKPNSSGPRGRPARMVDDCVAPGQACLGPGETAGVQRDLGLIRICIR